MPAPTRPVDAVRRLIDRRLGLLQELTGLPVVFGGAVERRRGSDHLVISEVRGTLSNALSGLAVPSGRGLGGSALEHSKPFVVSDYRSNGKITHHFDEHVVEQERITSVFAFPVQVDGRVEGVLYGASRDTRLIGDVALRRASGVALTLATEIGRLGPRPIPLLTSTHALTEIEAIAARIADPVLRARLVLAHRSLTAAATPPAPLPAATRLAPREVQCLALAATGATNLQIATDLGLGTETVKAYLRSAMRRLKVGNRTAAVHVARAAGLI